jgi:hypothetical protein
MNIARRHHRLGLIAPDTLRVQTALNSALAIAEDFGIGSVHSKWSFSLVGLALNTFTKPKI